MIPRNSQNLKRMRFLAERILFFVIPGAFDYLLNSARPSIA